MAVERDLELLDDYLTNRLTGTEKEMFEKRVESDPSLKSEFKIQQKLIEGIKNARVAELKSMLNNTVIPPVSNTALLTKAASWIIIAGIVGTGAYFLLKDKDTVEIAQQQQTTGEQKVTQQTEAIAPTSDVKSDATEATTTSSQPVQSGNNQSVAEQEKKIEQKPVAGSNKAVVATPENRIANRQKPEVFDPSGENESSASLPVSEGIKTGTAPKKLVPSSIEVETNGTNKKYDFHYQFKSGKLLLYGSFEKNLYEIMEFFSGSKRTVFLFYKDSYYLLNEDNDKIKPLVTINDPVMLEKLKEYRANN